MDTAARVSSSLSLPAASLHGHDTVTLAQAMSLLAIVGDHSTPSKLRSHSWHPVPLLIRSEYGRRDHAARYTEEEAQRGSLGLRKGTDLMPLLMANALKLNKYGA